MALRVFALVVLACGASASSVPRARRIGRSHARDGTCSLAKQGMCLTGSPIAPFSSNTSSAAECCALCNKYKFPTTTVKTPCGNWTYNTNNTVAPYWTCLLLPPTTAYTNATTCTSGAPGPGPCQNNTDCNAGV